MNRKGFLKNLFGVAVVAAMPPIVVDKLSKLPPPTTPVKPLPLPKEFTSGNTMCIFDRFHLIGWSNKFTLNFHQERIDVTSSRGRWEKRVVGRKKNGKKKKRWYFIPATGYYSEYIPGSKHWDISEAEVEWYVDPMIYFEKAYSEPMRCLIQSNGLKIEANGILTEIDMSAPFEKEGMSSMARFEGTGVFIIESNE